MEFLTREEDGWMLLCRFLFFDFIYIVPELKEQKLKWLKTVPSIQWKQSEQKVIFHNFENKTTKYHHQISMDWQQFCHHYLERVNDLFGTTAKINFYFNCHHPTSQADVFR